MRPSLSELHGQGQRNEYGFNRQRKDSETLRNGRVASSGLSHDGGKGGKGVEGGERAPPVSVEAFEFAPGEALRETIAEKNFRRISAVMLGLSLKGPSCDFLGGVLGERKAVSVWHGMVSYNFLARRVGNTHGLLAHLRGLPCLESTDSNRFSNNVEKNPTIPSPYEAGQ